MSESIVPSDTPASAILVAAVCLRSCNRQFTPARLRNVPQAVFIVVVGPVGSLGTGFPNGKMYKLGRVSPNRFVYYSAWAERTWNSSRFIGIWRPAPPVSRATRRKVFRIGERACAAAPSSRSSSSGESAEPASLRSSSFRTFAHNTDHF